MTVTHKYSVLAAGKFLLVFKSKLCLPKWPQGTSDDKNGQHALLVSKSF